MKCGGCSAAVKRILMENGEIRSAAVNLLTESAVFKVSAESDKNAHGKQAAELLTKQVSYIAAAELLIPHALDFAVCRSCARMRFLSCFIWSAWPCMTQYKQAATANSCTECLAGCCRCLSIVCSLMLSTSGLPIQDQRPSARHAW